jgi:hypothetical protein
VLVIALSVAAYAGIARAQDSANLYLAHAASGRDISSTADPAFPIDISISGVCVIKGESFGEILGPFSLPAGDTSFRVSMANSLNPCGNSSIFSAAPTLAAGTSLGVVSNQGSTIIGRIYPVNLSPMPVGDTRALVTNATAQNLAATVTADPRIDGSGGQFNVPAGTMREANPPIGAPEYTSIYLQGTTTLEAGPYGIETHPRTVYLYVFAGSAANHSVQLIGPKAILNVL